MKEFRDFGAIGALLDEYERAIEGLDYLISNLSHQQLIEIVDYSTKDDDCRSIQTILAHVIESGYNYVIVIRKYLGEEISYMDREMYKSIEEYRKGIIEMFQYNVRLFDDYPNMIIEEKDPDKKILVRWGQRFDIEQLMEHAIVHILRHRRQIERFLLT